MRILYQTLARIPKTEEWKPVKYCGEHFYSDHAGLGQLQQMTAMMAQVFKHLEYKIERVTI